MSLFQCDVFGCIDNTACAALGFAVMQDHFDWTDIPGKRGKMLCSACGPEKFADGKPTAYGKWHNRFEQNFLPMHMFKTSKNGSLEHINTGDQDYSKYLISS